MPRPTATSPIRFSAALTQYLPADPPATSGVPYLGFTRPVAGPALPGYGVGFVHHPGSLAAMGLINLPTPGQQSGFFFEPAPGWNAPGAVIRPVRLLAVMLDTALVSEAIAGLPALFGSLSALGVTVAVVRSSQRPNAALVPLLTLAPVDASTNVTLTRLNPGYLDAPAAGGRVMVAELNSVNWCRGGMYQSIETPETRGGYTPIVSSLLPITTPAGANAYACGLGDGRIFTFPADAAADNAAAAVMAGGLEEYHHYVYQRDTSGTFVGVALAVPSADAVYADTAGDDDFTTRRVVSAADLGELWSTLTADALAFFSA